MRCRYKFSKRKEKNKRMKRTKKKQRSMFSMHLDFYKISLGHFQTRSKSLSRALLQFEHTNAQHTGIWWLLRPTFCQAAPFVITRIDDAIVHTHWSDVIVWKSQCIQTAKARTCISHTFFHTRWSEHLTSLMSWSI